ncbi:DUF4097 family beta strand repeat-containing protein [Halalkalibacter krulwichiae]|uniref:DUF4097 domain-containing protein n=1 Tax=Halalkalibacter krulwichiae TaxID=199441 RepID=A0A1X9M993_9BACI|nr:DUF4097 family beta strand repeat-containing protein [Halalkalibacter krulwichiae]ARK29180.1 hypothetical protein BkAM31D_04520 [Halalkalibacter krulwichiae]
MKKLLGIFLIIVGLGFLIVTITSWFTASNTVNQGKDFSQEVGSIEKLELASTSTDWYIETTNSDEIVIKLINADNQMDIHSLQRGNTLKVEVKERKFKWLSFNFKGQTKAVVQLPVEYKNHLAINAISGNIGIENEMLAQSLTLKSVSGDIRAEKLESSKVNASTTSGDLMFGEMDVRESQFNTVSGNLSVSQLKGEIEGESVSGNMTIEFSEENQRTKLKSVSGDVTVALQTGNPEVKVKSVSGKLLVAPNFTGKINEGSVGIEIETVSGDIQITQK